MADARKIQSAHDLARIHSDGHGYVLYPFGRKIHHATCKTVPGMSLNPKEPRWFAPDDAAAIAYQAHRAATYPSAKPFETVICCADKVPGAVCRGGTASGSSPSRIAKPVSAPVPKHDPPGEREWACRAEPRAFSLWTQRRTPFMTDQSPAQKAMIREITPHVAKLTCDGRSRLQGVFTSDDVSIPQPDAENIAFYNFSEAPFVGCGAVLSFERSYRSAPPAPGGGAYRFHHRWAVVPVDAPFECWRESAEVCAWRDVPVDLNGDLALNLWRAIREHSERVKVLATLMATDDFGVEVTLALPTGVCRSVVRDTKALVDGPLAAFQRTEALSAEIVTKLLGRKWGRAIDEATLRRLVSGQRPIPVFPRAPFNRNGLDPCDERCVAGLVRIVPGSGPASVSGRVFRGSAS